jgi:hypothetical protein
MGLNSLRTSLGEIAPALALEPLPHQALLFEWFPRNGDTVR